MFCTYDSRVSLSALAHQPVHHVKYTHIPTAELAVSVLAVLDVERDAS